MVVDAVSGELVSGNNSLVTGNLTGNLENSGLMGRLGRQLGGQLGSFECKFPGWKNREFRSMGRQTNGSNREAKSPD